MSAPTGSAASSLISEARADIPDEPVIAAGRRCGVYLRDLARRRGALALRRNIVYGLVMGWFLTLVFGFIFFCVNRGPDWLWASLTIVGLLHLAAAVIIPQALAWPERAWTALAHWQGWLVMTLLLSVIYYALLWPASCFSKRRTRGFVAWYDRPGTSASAWQPIEHAESIPQSTASNRYRSLPLLLGGVISFFFRRGNYLLVLIVILLVVLGLILFFVESTALAPFIYTLF